jgi:ribosomal protein S27E
MASGRAASRQTPPFIDPPGYARHRPERTLLYRLVEMHYPTFVAAREAAERPLPKHVQREFEAYLRCGRFEHGFLRVQCDSCHAEKLVAFSCKGRAICPSCGARRMAETAALLTDEVLPRRPMRQCVLSLPFALRFLLARDPAVLTQVLAIVYRAIAGYVLNKARLTTFDPAAGGPMDDLLGHSITYRVAMGPRAGQKVFSLQSVPAQPPETQKKGLAQASGFYSGHPALRPSGQPSAVQNSSRRFCPCMPASASRPTHGPSSSGCAAMSAARPWRRNGLGSPSEATCICSLRQHTETAPRTSFWSRSIVWRAWLRSCRLRG